MLKTCLYVQVLHIINNYNVISLIVVNLQINMVGRVKIVDSI